MPAITAVSPAPSAPSFNDQALAAVLLWGHQHFLKHLPGPMAVRGLAVAAASSIAVAHGISHGLSLTDLLLWAPLAGTVVIGGGPSHLFQHFFSRPLKSHEILNQDLEWIKHQSKAEIHWLLKEFPPFRFMRRTDVIFQTSPGLVGYLDGVGAVSDTNSLREHAERLDFLRHVTLNLPSGNPLRQVLERLELRVRDPWQANGLALELVRYVIRESLKTPAGRAVLRETNGLPSPQLENGQRPVAASPLAKSA